MLEPKLMIEPSSKLGTRIKLETASSNLEKIYDETISTREPIVITREGYETVSVIPTAELNSLMETAYLFGSGENAARLLDALQRAKARTNKPLTIEDLRQEFGLDKEEEKVSA
jgi:antitoxin YefM